jgi:eukaryotic-like serine/threonine-protein kinase
MSLATGSRIGPYEVKALLGAGGMGQVWRAHDTRLERDVALKVLPAEALGDDTARARLVREARLASKLNHPHICTIYDVGEAVPQTPFVLSVSKDEQRAEDTGSGQAVTYIAMELVEGQSLSARVVDGPLPIEQVLRYGRQMADALAHAHARGVVHRDFKSANVVVTPDGQVKVLDFGLAKRLSDEQLADVTTVSRHSLTAPGMVAGTLAYMAPEQLQGQPADARGDIWALGVVLYELATGKRPFQGQTGFDLTAAILRQPLPALPSSVPAPLAGVIERCLAKEPGARYQQGSEVRAALEAVASGEMGAAWSAWRVLLRQRRRLLLGAAAGVLALLVVAALLVGFDVGGVRSRVTGAAGATARVVRLAVLPFANISGDAEQDYLSDGLTTEMIALLGRLHPATLHVIARTTSMRYKKTDKSVDQIGHELGVDYVLEGSAQREAGRIRITADLIKVADQTQLWAERYERELAGILALQNDVAQKVAQALAVKLLPAEQARLAGAKTVDPEVYDLCLKGGYHMGRLTPAELDTAEQYFQQALAKDARSADGYVGMSALWALRQQFGYVPAREAGPKAKAFALKAVELDDTLSDGHGVLADAFAYVDYNFPAAEREYQRTLELDPNSAASLFGYGHILMILGRPDEALHQDERALALDPLDDGVRAFYALHLTLARRYDEALAQANEVLRKQPGNMVALGALYQSAHMKRQFADVIAALALVYEQGGRPAVAAALKKGFADSGYAEALRNATAAELAKHAGEGSVAMDAATNHAMAGDRALALDWLEKAYADRDPNMPFIGCNPIFDPLRAEPRFQALLRRMNLPQ